MTRPIPIRGADGADVASILLVDDRPANLLALEAILEPMHQRLVRAESGEDALKRIAETDFAVILMDVRMPEMDGLRVLEVMNQREEAARIPVILLTAVSLESGDIARGYERGAVDFLLKPFDPAILRSKVSVFVDLHLKEQTIKRQAAMLRQRDREAFERRSEQRFRNLMDALPQCVWAANANWDVYYSNYHAANYTGLRVDHPTPLRELLALIHPEDRADMESKLAGAASLTDPVEVQVRLRRNLDEQYRWFLMRGVPQTDESGAITGWIVAGTDIDVERHALQQAQMASQMKEEFLALVSHELRNPLNAIKGWAHILRSGPLNQALTLKALETIERNVELQSALINDILDVANIVRGKLNLNTRPLHVVTVVEAAIAAIRPAAEAKGIELSYEAGPANATISGDADRLQQVFWNLLSNAIKFTPQGGKVSVTMVMRDNDLAVIVKDSGRGIGADFLPYVFDRFRQGETGTARTQGGLGIGLTIARQIVELHGGYVRAESLGADQGATFTIFLPLRERVTNERRLESRQREGRTRALENFSVLVVDDEPDARDLMSEVLALYGARATVAASAAEALQEIDRNPPQILVSDIAMPHTDGYAFIRKVRERISPEKLPAVAVTGLGRAADRERALAAGFQQYLVKPISPTGLVEAILSLFDPAAKAKATVA